MPLKIEGSPRRKKINPKEEAIRGQRKTWGARKPATKQTNPFEINLSQIEDRRGWSTKRDKLQAQMIYNKVTKPIDTYNAIARKKNARGRNRVGGGTNT